MDLFRRRSGWKLPVMRGLVYFVRHHHHNHQQRSVETKARGVIHRRVRQAMNAFNEPLQNGTPMMNNWTGDGELPERGQDRAL